MTAVKLLQLLDELLGVNRRRYPCLVFGFTGRPSGDHIGNQFALPGSRRRPEGDVAAVEVRDPYFSQTRVDRFPDCHVAVVVMGIHVVKAENTARRSFAKDHRVRTGIVAHSGSSSAMIAGMASASCGEKTVASARRPNPVSTFQ